MKRPLLTLEKLRKTIVWAFFGLAFFAACGPMRGRFVQKKYLATTVLTASAAEKGEPTATRARLFYTGCGGFFLEFGGRLVALDPFFSNRNLADALASGIRTDTATAEAFFEKKLGWKTGGGAEKLAAVLVSHGHYDHLADVPFLLQKAEKSRDLQVFGSRTAANLLRSFPAILPDTARQLVDLERLLEAQKADSAIGPFFIKSLETGRPVVRFWAVPSSHAGHFWFFGSKKIPFIGGDVSAPLAAPPRQPTDWKEGRNFNFLIDLLDERGAAAFRIFSSAGSAASAPVGWPPSGLLAEKRVDLALVCGANWNQAANYPDGLLARLRPATVFVGHWEDFFQPIPRLLRRPATVPGTDVPELLNRLERAAKTAGFEQKILLGQPTATTVELRF